MNRVTPSRRGEVVQAARELGRERRRGAAVPRKVSTGGRGRSVGSCRPGHAGEPLAPPGEPGLQRLALEHARAARPRSRRTGSAARAGATAGPSANAVVERRELADQDAHRPAVGDDVVQGRGPGRAPPGRAGRAGRAAAARARGRTAAAPPRWPAAAARPRAALRGSPERSISGHRGGRCGRDDLERPAAARRRRWCAATRGARDHLGERLPRALATAAGRARRSRAGCCRRRCPARAGRGTRGAPGRRRAAARPRPAGAAAAGSAARASAAARPLDRRGQAASVGASKSARTGSSTPSASRTRGDQPRGEQRVAAEREEVVAGARPARQPRSSLQIPASSSSSGVRGATPPRPRRLRSGAGRARRSTLPLAFKGQLRQEHEGRGHHVGGQRAAEEAAQLRGVRSRLARATT